MNIECGGFAKANPYKFSESTQEGSRNRIGVASFILLFFDGSDQTVISETVEGSSIIARMGLTHYDVVEQVDIEDLGGGA